jgi:hypothetical protein
MQTRFGSGLIGTGNRDERMFGISGALWQAVIQSTSTCDPDLFLSLSATAHSPTRPISSRPHLTSVARDDPSSGLRVRA